MWRPWWMLLNLFGKIRIPRWVSYSGLRVGDPQALDAGLAPDWRRYTRAETLFDLWGPPPGSPWRTYHAVPLFASLRVVKPDRLGPTLPAVAATIEAGPHLSAAAPHVKPLGAAWAEARVWVILDLPGVQAVPLAARFMAGGYQPVCTFDHWPDPKGVVKGEEVLAQLLRYASVIAPLRADLTPQSPPVWICDRQRLAPQPGKPGVFDNRYYLDESAVPGPEALRAAGLTRIYCVVPRREDRPSDDLCAYFRDLRQLGVLDIQGVALNDANLKPFAFAESVFQITFNSMSYGRSAAGGFGVLIPEPSSGGG